MMDVLSTMEGEAEIKQYFDSLPVDEDGRVLVNDFQDLIKTNHDLLFRITGLDANASPRFRAFSMVGRFNAWIREVFRRLGLTDSDRVTWEEFMAGGRAT